MMIEHSFITTQDERASLDQAAAALTALGFRPDTAGPAQAMAFRRGRRVAAYAKRISELPQHMLISFDRGRVDFAASVEEHRRYRKQPAILEEMLRSLAEAVEGHVGGMQPIERTRVRWNGVHTRIEELYRKRRRKNAVVIIVLVAIIVGLIAWTCSRL